MAKGREKFKARQAELNALGRPLARRAKSTCELCSTAGVSLKPYEVPPVPLDPELDQTLLLCEGCTEGADDPKLGGDRWRFLENAVWSELPPAQVVAVRMVRRLAEAQNSWAIATADTLYLAPEVEAWIDGRLLDDDDTE